jgi:hypothetical protein
MFNYLGLFAIRYMQNLCLKNDQKIIYAAAIFSNRLFINSLSCKVEIYKCIIISQVLLFLTHLSPLHQLTPPPPPPTPQATQIRMAESVV